MLFACPQGHCTLGWNSTLGCNDQRDVISKSDFLFVISRKKVTTVGGLSYLADCLLANCRLADCRTWRIVVLADCRNTIIMITLAQLHFGET